MKHPMLSLLILAFVLSLSACGKSEEPAEKATAPATGSAEAPKSDVAKTLEKAAEKGRESAEAAADAAALMTERAREKGGELAEATKQEGVEMADAASAKAEELIAKAKGYIGRKDVDLAAEVMAQLRELRGSLPQSVKEKIDQLEGMLTTAKRRGAVSEPVASAGPAAKQLSEPPDHASLLKTTGAEYWFRCRGTVLARHFWRPRSAVVRLILKILGAALAAGCFCIG